MLSEQTIIGFQKMDFDKKTWSRGIAECHGSGAHEAKFCQHDNEFDRGLLCGDAFILLANAVNIMLARRFGSAHRFYFTFRHADEQALLAIFEANMQLSIILTEVNILNDTRFNREALHFFSPLYYFVLAANLKRLMKRCGEPNLKVLRMFLAFHRVRPDDHVVSVGGEVDPSSRLYIR